MHTSDYWGSIAGSRWHGDHRAKRGNTAPIILRLLLEKPMYGYEIISRLEGKSFGMWRPSAGSIYPNLQMLEEQELIASKEEKGKKVYHLTEKGKAEAAQAEETARVPWEEKAKHAKKFIELKHLLFENLWIIKELAMEDSDEKMESVKKILEDTKKKLDDLVDEPKK